MKVKKHRYDVDPLDTASAKKQLDLLLCELDFNPEAIIDATVKQPRLFSQVAKYRADCVLKYRQAKTSLEVVRADCALSIRKDATDEGERISENAVAERLASYDQVQMAQAEFAMAEKEEEYAKLLVDAFRMRRDSIRVVADMVAYNLGSAAGGGEEAKTPLKKLRDRASAHYPGSDE